MTVIHYSDHLKLRLKLRKIPEEYPREVYTNFERQYVDIEERRDVRIKKLHYNQKLRNMMIAFDKTGDAIDIVTIHPISEGKILNRLTSGRWRKK